MEFVKYHALGNDYLVIAPGAPGGAAPSGDRIRAICHRNYGVGSDGILWGPLPAPSGSFGLRIFNPDGSEAEKSGNGVRIFCRFLWDRGQVREEPFTVLTPGGPVRATALDGGRSFRLDMGRVRFGSEEIPLRGQPHEVLNETLVAGDRTFTFCAATVGNPHCVVLLPEVDEALARRYGPLIERDPRFPNRTNVQFMRVRDRNNIEIEIWERGAGYTLASGTSASAAAGVARRLGLVDADVQVHAPGGALEVKLDEQYRVELTGPVTRVASGVIDPEILGPG